MGSEEAIKSIGGPCVVLAGAGTGKTYTIVEKIKYLISQGNEARKIVCITFSNEAANNLVLRIRRILNLKEGEEPIIRTFHGFGSDLLRQYGDKIGLEKSFKILDPDQAKVVLHRNLRVNVGNCHKYVSTIGTAKDLGISLEDFEIFLKDKEKKYEGVDLEKRLENLSFELNTIHLSKVKDRKKEILNELFKVRNIVEIKKFVKAWGAYEKIKEKGKYLDYSDLNTKALELLTKFPEVSKDFEYFIVDEFQDTNKVQLDFLIKLAWNKNITVVGDMNQSIYRFRGAYKENLAYFKKEFNVSNDSIYNLDKSYRSSNKILRTAHKLILNNYENPEECFFVDNAHNKEGDKVEVYELKDAQEEARKVVELVKRELESGIPEEEICIMFRAHQYGRVIRKILDENEIDYCAVAKQSLLKQKSIRTAVDYLVILNKLKKKERNGEQEWWDLVYRLDFSESDLIKIGKFIKEFNKENEKKEEKEILSVKLFNSLTALDLSESGKMASKVLIEKIKAMLDFSEKPISELLREVYRISGLMNEQKSREEKEIMLNLNKFYEIAKAHEELYDSDLSNFIYYLEVLGNLGIDIGASELEEKGVRLMTSHSTKGLEYKTVIITNMASKRFPIETLRKNWLIPTELLPEVKEDLKGKNEEEKEGYVEEYERHNQLLEERRLAYVSFTRPKEKLILTFADNYGNRKTQASKFLQEIEFDKNEDISFEKDLEKKYEEPEAKFKRASDINSALRSKDFDSVLAEIIGEKTNEKGPVRKFSPSALLLFDNCEKQFEYKYVYNMPDKKTVSWEAMRLGSFVHLVLEKGVSNGFKEVEDFLEIAKEMNLEEDWESVEFKEAETLIRVFYERNKEKYSKNSKTEQYLPLEIGGLSFTGFADRIDFNPSGKAEIVDYKTGKTNVSPKARNWQLGFYALAAKEKYGEVCKVTLDMLRQDKPLEFEIDEKGNAICKSSSRLQGFNIYEVEAELIKAAHKIQEAYKSGFKACSVEKNCEFCNEYVYGL